MFAILLIASLLVCPLRCVSCQTVAANDSDSGLAKCSCCHCDVTSLLSKPQENGPPADRPEEDCTCPNCICEGATLQDGVKLPAANASPPVFCHLSAEIDRDVQVVIVREFAREAHDCNCYHCGRDARIAHRSWLV